MVNSTRKEKRLGSSAEDYLEAVYLLCHSGPPARVTDLAERLAVSKPSVVAGMAALEKRGLVRHEHYGTVELTASGLVTAERIYRRHRILREFLATVLGVSPAVAESDACAIEHVLSPETVERLENLVEACRGEGGDELRERLASCSKPNPEKGNNAR